MNIDTKYKIGNVVWAMVDNRPVEKMIVAIEVRQVMKMPGVVIDPRVTYFVSIPSRNGTLMNSAIPEDLIAGTKKDLLAKL